MAAQFIQIDEFVSLSGRYPVLDVRSPAEYNHAHISGAHSLALFTDAERAQIGTAYKQVSREAAIRIGLGAFGPRMNEMIARVEEIAKQHLPQHVPDESEVLVHCWRGGMRSAAVAWLLDLYGFKVHVLEGGYKAYRNWALRRMYIPYNLKVIGGNTGAGKTIVLHELQKKGYSVLDLEHIAGHKGSAFGGLEGHVQPGQEQFENTLADRLYQLTIEDAGIEIYVEDESQRIGAVNLPSGFFDLLRQSPQYFLDVPFEARLDHILKEYGQFSVESLINAIVRIKKRLGPLETKTAVNFLIEGDKRACFAILLTYYDKQYLKSLQLRGTDAGQLQSIMCHAAEAGANIQSLIQIMDVHASS